MVASVESELDMHGPYQGRRAQLLAELYGIPQGERSRAPLQDDWSTLSPEPSMTSGWQCSSGV